MEKKFQGKDNALLVEFEAVVDLDLAIYRYVKTHYSTSPLVDPELIKLESEPEIIHHLLSRKHINPLEILMPHSSPEVAKRIYYNLMDDMESELLKLATPYDTLSLMLTFLEQASSIHIDILCQNELEEAYIKAKSEALNTIISKKADVDLSQYSALFLKYAYNFMQYQEPFRKHVYIHAAGYNSDEEHNSVNLQMASIISKENDIKVIDPYRGVKYFFQEDYK